MDRNKNNDERFEFILYINNNIICQRFFNIFKYNSDVLNSIELKETHDYCVEILKDDLKEKSIEYLWGYYNPYKVQLEDDIQRIGVNNRIDTYGFEIKVDGKTKIKSEFSGNIYPPRVRYSVNIKDIVPKIIYEIRDGFSRKDYSSIYA